MRTVSLLAAALAFASVAMAAPIPGDDDTTTPPAAAATDNPVVDVIWSTAPHSFLVSTETPIVGEEIALSWSGGVAPFNISVDSYQPTSTVGQRVVEAWREPSMMVHNKWTANGSNTSWVANVRPGTTL